MKYGIDMNAAGDTCANCGKPAEDYDFCPHCGAPLTISAIGDYEENKENLIKNVLNSLKTIAKENKTDSLKDVLKIFND